MTAAMIRLTWLNIRFPLANPVTIRPCFDRIIYRGPHGKDDRGAMPRRHAAGLRREPRFHGAGGAAPYLRRDGASHENQANSHAWRKIRGVHGRRLRARVG